MAVQDDRREVEVRDLIGLRAGETRSGVDAYFDFSDGNRRYAVPVELKSTTNRTVSTARDVGPAHIRKWRSRLWVFGFYDPGLFTIRLSYGPIFDSFTPA